MLAFMYGNEAGEHRLTELAVVNCKKMVKNARKLALRKIQKNSKISKICLMRPHTDTFLSVLGVSRLCNLVDVARR